MSESPLVSVVTPVYNGEAHVRECVESVLAQSYGHWDYTIVDNCSTDRTPGILREYAAREPRIRIERNQSFVGVIQNHNIAFRQISPQSQYCKLVAADDWLDPECLEKMVRLADEHPNVAIVGAYGYGFDGSHVVWDGLPYPRTVFPGREVCRASLLGGPHVFGTPSAVLYRSDIVRSRHAFFNEENLHADTEACLEFLEHHDFGFVHQVLTFSRMRQDSLTSYSTKLNTYLAGNLDMLSRYGPKYLTAVELAQVRRRHLAGYYEYLAAQLFERHEGGFWGFHAQKLAALGHPLSRVRLAGCVLARALDRVLNPKRTLEGVVRRIRSRLANASVGPGARG